ncbi:hypothetical protein BCV70DRAFT_197557 [Testicularia cyperi]|uniref:B30.2/SPRY domain-containing protein n=1 Tax=Testicularia cyperi TaxID=1882483 RepID=A0A317Y1A7_9BASI|nr:hypothetical protein BCV70DRAFT_197557 [Testicularia cyperi]
MDIDVKAEDGSASTPSEPPYFELSSLGSSSSAKRKYDDLRSQESDPAYGSSPPASSPQRLPSPPHERRSLSSTPAPIASTEAQKAYIARTAPHLLERTPTPSGSRNSSQPPSGRSSPSSDDDRLTPDAPGSATSAANQSHHILPPGYRGPVLRRSDAEDIAPRPALVPAVGSATMYNTANFAVNRNGWRYTAAGPASQDLPRTMFKTLETAPESIHWCWSDRSPFTKISADASVVSTDKGFRSARSNVGVRSGEWYAEVEILSPEQLVPGTGSPGPMPVHMRDGAHVRVGWGRREAPVNAPVGFDGYSYGFRDRTGDKVTLSRPTSYGKPFRAGDVVGMYIKLPEERVPEDENDPANIKRERIAIRYKNQLYFESLEYPRSREMEQLMERSRKSNSMEEALQGIEGTGIFEPSSSMAAGSEGASGSATAKSGPSTAAGGGGSAKVKNSRKNPASKDKASGPPKPSLRPVPKLKGSKIGFCINGEPQGIAFRDLFDFRPLRVRGFTNLKASALKLGNGKTGKGNSASKKGEGSELNINIKARENVFDDGALGYFPFVSVYGGARAKLVAGEEGFRFPPPDNLEAALEAASCQAGHDGALADQKEEGRSAAQRTWKPLCDRYAEHLAEMWRYDVADEAKVAAVAAKEAEEKARKAQLARDRYAAKAKPLDEIVDSAMADQAMTPEADPRGVKPATAMIEDEDDGDRTVTDHPDRGRFDSSAYEKGAIHGWDRDSADTTPHETPASPPPRSPSSRAQSPPIHRYATSDINTPPYHSHSEHDSMQIDNDIDTQPHALADHEHAADAHVQRSLSAAPTDASEGQRSESNLDMATRLPLLGASDDVEMANEQD